MDNKRPENPTAPRRFKRYRERLWRHLHGFISKLPETSNQTKAERFVSQIVRNQTLSIRNLFSDKGCEEALNGILSRIDDLLKRRWDSSYLTYLARQCASAV